MTHVYLCDCCFKQNSDTYCCYDGENRLVQFEYIHEGDGSADWSAALENDDIPMGFGATAEAALEDLQDKLISEREYQLERQAGYCE